MKKRIIAIVAIIALVAIFAMAFVACNREKDYRKRLQDAGYELLNKDDFEELMDLDLDGNEDWESIEWIVGGFKLSLVSIMTENYDMDFVLKFNDESKAEEFYDEMNAEPEEGMYLERKGKIVFMGTKQGIKDAQGK